MADPVRSLKKMKQHTQTIIAIGRSFDPDDDQTLALARTIPCTYFQNLAEGRFNEFDFLVDLPFGDAFDFIKGMVRCEELRISPYPGSTSLVIWAFNAIRRRPMDEWTKIAVWIVQNHDNPYSPFNFRRTRDHWEVALRESDNPIEIATRADEIEQSYQAKKHATAHRQAVRERIDKLNKGEVPESAEIRQRMIEELEREAGWPDHR